MPLHFPVNWRDPDYREVLQWRIDRLKHLRAHPQLLPVLRTYYRENIAQFIIDWGITFDPREADRKKPTWVPFLLFPRQEDWVAWFIERWQSQEPGITEKSRDMGMSWLMVGVAASLCMLRDGIIAGFGSRKEEYVDKIDNPKSLFWKARQFIGAVPREFRGSWDASRDAPHMRIIFRDTGSAMTGEAGDNIGRGDRTSFHFVDESAHLERAELVDAALSQTTRCRQDVSSVNGSANSFAVRRHSGKIKVFTFHWRDDPRKDEDWYRKQKEELDPVVLAQEVDIDYAASVEGVVIPPAWVRAALDAHKKLGVEPTGEKLGALDVADEGRDANAFCAAHGILIEHIEEWSGKGGDIFATVEKAFSICDDKGYPAFRYDADGLGAGARGDARIINERRKENGQRVLEVIPYRGSEEVFDPDGLVDPKGPPDGRRNKDYFANHKAQSWWRLRKLFMNTYRAVVEQKPFDRDEIISISSAAGPVQKLMTELSQATYSINGAGKMVIDKQPDGMMSPNMADGVVIRCALVKRTAMKIDRGALARI